MPVKGTLDSSAKSWSLFSHTETPGKVIWSVLINVMEVTVGLFANRMLN